MIRLLEKAAKHPNYAKALGVEGESIRYRSETAAAFCTGSRRSYNMQP